MDSDLTSRTLKDDAGVPQESCTACESLALQLDAIRRVLASSPGLHLDQVLAAHGIAFRTDIRLANDQRPFDAGDRLETFRTAALGEGGEAEFGICARKGVVLDLMALSSEERAPGPGWSRVDPHDLRVTFLSERTRWVLPAETLLASRGCIGAGAACLIQDPENNWSRLPRDVRNKACAACLLARV